MAKRNRELTGGGEKAKIRVFFAELEGSNESVQEALKAMVAGMSRPVRIIPDQNTNGKEPVLVEADIEEVEDSTDETLGNEISNNNGAPQSARRPRGTGKKTDRNAGLQLVPDLDFRPTGELSLKEFFQQKNPGNDLETVVAIIYYMRNFMDLDKISPSHVMTAFKEIGKPIPVDLRQTIRNVKKSKMWLNFSDIEDIRVTTQGSNFVEHDLGAGK